MIRCIIANCRHGISSAAHLQVCYRLSDIMAGKETEYLTKKSTIVIPNYNGMAYMEACLQSVFTQSVSEYDVIIVDNHSTDGSLEWMREHYPHIQLIINQENDGFCKAVNQGIQIAKTPYVVLLNNDTVIDHDFLKELEKVMDQDDHIFSASAQMLVMKQPELIDSAGDFYCALGWAYGDGKGKPASRYNRNRRIFSACGGAAIYRRKVFEEIGYFDEAHFAYLEDIDIGYRSRIYGYQNLYAAKAKVLHAGSAVSGSRYNAFKTRQSSKNNVYLVYKNMPLLQLLLNFPFLLAGFMMKTLFFIKKGFGRIYLQGLWNGILLCASPQGRKQKVPFRIKHFGNYCIIELELLWNMLRRLM